jgi:hypothetical protein
MEWDGGIEGFWLVMLDPRLRLITIAVCLVVAGPLAGSVVGGLRLPDGSSGATGLTSQTPGVGALVLLVAISIAGLAGVGASRLFGARHGMLCAGLVMAWVAWRQGTAERIVMQTRDGASMLLLALEGVLVGVAGVLVAAAVLAADGGRGREGRSDLGASVAQGAFVEVWMGNLAALIRGFRWGGGGWVVSAGVGLVLAASAATLLGVEGLKGQMVFAAVGAGALAGAASRALERGRELAVVSVLAPFVAIGVLGVAGPLVAWWFQRGEVVEMAFAGRLFRVANPIASDWLAGALLGMPLGVTWAGSLLPRPIPAS